MAQIYYIDTLGSNLNVFEKKTKGSEHSYYIYLNKKLITEADIGQLTKTMQNFIPVSDLRVGIKRGKMAFQVIWSYLVPTPLSKQEELFNVIFNWLKDFGYVDTYQPKTTKTSTTSTTRVQTISLPNKQLQVGDEFYFMSTTFDKLKSFKPLYKLDSISNSGILAVSWIDEFGKAHTLNNWISKEDAEKYVKSGTITFPEVTTTTSTTTKPINKDYKVDDFFITDVSKGTISRIVSIYPNKDVKTMAWSSKGYIFSLYDKDSIDKNLDSGKWEVLKVSRGDKFLSVSGLAIFHVIMDYGGSPSIEPKVVFDLINPTTNRVEDGNVEKSLYDFNSDLIKNGFDYIGNEFSSNTSGVQTQYTPIQVGDEFVFTLIPFKPDADELKNVRRVIGIDFNRQDQEIEYESRNGNNYLMGLSQARQYIDEGNMIVTKKVNQSNSTPQGKITSLSYYDLFRRLDDGKLFRVLNVIGVLDKNDKFEKIQDSDLVDLESYEGVAKDFMVQHIPLSGLNKNIEDGILEYLGQVREGDSFMSVDEGVERYVIRVDDYPHDVVYNVNDISVYPPKSNAIGVSLVMNVFTKTLIEYNYKLNSRKNTISNTNVASPTITPKPKINSDEIDALKKEIADLLFLKNGISDLDFEEKINISTEISQTQRKIDDLTEKLFEERVGDENFFDKLFDQSFTPLKDRYDMEIVKNTLPEIISPSGQMSDLDESLQMIANSNDFKNWFGDWRNAYFYRNLDDFGGLNVSKVMTDKFEPQLVWHGTNNEFSYFDFEMFPANYFAVNKEYSEFFAINKGSSGYVLPFFLNIKNPLDLSDFGIGKVSSKDFFDWMFLMTGMTPEELEVNPLFLDPTLPPNPIWVYIRNNPTMLKKIAQGNVYDGIKFYEFNPNVDPSDKLAYETLAYIIFDPHQAKLADPNRGEILLSSLKSFMLKRGGKI
jgi:hypothetical protein